MGLQLAGEAKEGWIALSVIRDRLILLELKRFSFSLGNLSLAPHIPQDFFQNFVVLRGRGV